MIYTPEMLASMKKVEAAREANMASEPRRLTAEANSIIPTIVMTVSPPFRSAPTKAKRLPLN